MLQSNITEALYYFSVAGVVLSSLTMGKLLHISKMTCTASNLEIHPRK